MRHASANRLFRLWQCSELRTWFLLSIPGFESLTNANVFIFSLQWRPDWYHSCWRWQQRRSPFAFDEALKAFAFIYWTFSLVWRNWPYPDDDTTMVVFCWGQFAYEYKTFLAVTQGVELFLCTSASWQFGMQLMRHKCFIHIPQKLLSTQ